MASTEHNEASRIELSLGALIEDLRNSNGDINDVQQLNKQIRQLLNELRVKIKILEVQLRDCKTNDEKEQMKEMIDWHTMQLIDLQKNVQRANLSVKSKQQQKERNDLLRIEQESIRMRKQESVLQSTSNVTDSLRELRHTLSTSLKSSEDTMKTLINSSEVLKDTNKEMKNMTSHIDISSRLITKFGRREVVDKLLIFFGLVLFFSVVIYILKKRLIG